MDDWNRCNICGKYIGLDAFCGTPPTAINLLVTPSSEISEETWDTYHVACKGDITAWYTTISAVEKW